MVSFRTPNPYDTLPELPALTVSSDTFAAGDTWGTDQVSGIFGAGGRDISPELHWSGSPAGTLSYAVTVFDPDAPTASGFWHWAVANIPATVTSLPAGAGSGEPGALPAAAITLRNDGGLARFLGAAPPPGHGPHRYIVAVHALPVVALEVTADSTPASLGFTLFSQATARGTLTGLFER